MDQEVAGVARKAIEAGDPAMWFDLVKILLSLALGAAGTFLIQSLIAARQHRRDEARHRSQLQHERARHRDQMDHERTLAADRYEQERRLQRDRLVIGDVLRHRALLIDTYLTHLRKLDAFIATVGSASREIAEGRLTAEGGRKLLAEMHPDLQLRQLLEICMPIFQVVAELADETLEETARQMREVIRAVADHGLATPLETFETWQHARTQSHDRLTELRGDVTGLLADLP